jgi:hypothetical protein
LGVVRGDALVAACWIDEDRSLDTVAFKIGGESHDLAVEVLWVRHDSTNAGVDEIRVSATVG